METWWRGINKSDLFNAFLRDMAEVLYNVLYYIYLYSLTTIFLTNKFLIINFLLDITTTIIIL